MSHIVYVVPAKRTPTAQLYDVLYQGDILVAGTKSPENDACRALVAMGLKGPLEVWANGGVYPHYRFKDIEQGALRTIKEDEKRGPRRAKYEEFDRLVLDRA